MGEPPVIDRRLVPPGVVPRHLQQWVLIGIALVMIGILAIAGGGSKSRSNVTSTAPGPSAHDPNQERIEAYQRRIQEQAQRLAKEQADLTRVKQAVAGATPPVMSETGSGSDRQPGTSSSAGPDLTFRQERAQREYRSLFADNVAYHHDDTRSRERPAEDPSQTKAQSPVSEARSTATTSERTYRLSEGTVVETVLANRLDGTFAGPVNCLVTTDVYASDEQHMLIPAGSRVLGEARPVNTFGQSRLAVVFHRLVLPNGASFDLHDFHGLNQAGDAGLSDQVNRHYAQIFGASLAIGAIAGLAQAGTGVGIDATTWDVYRQGAAANLAQSSARVLDRFLNILPTVTIREGHRIKVYLSNDLLLPEFHESVGSAGDRR